MKNRKRLRYFFMTNFSRIIHLVISLHPEEQIKESRVLLYLVRGWENCMRYTEKVLELNE